MSVLGKLSGTTTGRPLRTLVLVLATLIMVQTAGAAWLAVRTRDAQRMEGTREAVLVAARTQAVNMVSIDYRQADLGIQRILRGMTGKLRDDFASKQAPILARTVRKAQTISRGTALSAGIVALDEDSAEVIVAGNTAVQSLRTDDTKDHRPVNVRRLWRATLEMRRLGDRWLTEKMDMEIIG